VAPAVPQSLRGDPLRLGQILTNLVNNAVKFTEHGEIRMKIELLDHTGAKVQLKFSVRDTGIGMTPEQSGKLFQAVHPGRHVHHAKHGGTGLGLTISRRLVELMGGRIWIESAAGVGSNFQFTAWFELGSGPPGPHPAQATAHAARAGGGRQPAAREILSDALKDVAARVDVVGSGRRGRGGAAARRHGALRRGVHGLAHAGDGRHPGHSPHQGRRDRWRTSRRS
jgi:hypothetical protein